MWAGREWRRSQAKRWSCRGLAAGSYWQYGQIVIDWPALEDHCATCFADGVQVATGCTLGKGNIKKLHYGKWGLTLIDKKTKRAVRVVPRAEAMQRSKESQFMQLRKSGVPASQVPAEVATPLVEMVANAPDEALLKIGEVFEYDWQDAPHTFESVVCASCGEMTVTRNARVTSDGQVVCIPCSGYGK